MNNVNFWIYMNIALNTTNIIRAKKNIEKPV